MALQGEIRFRVLVALYALLVVVALCYAYSVRQMPASLYVQAPGSVEPVVVAVINGEPITQPEFEATLSVVGGADVLRTLMEQKVVFQEASRKNLEVDDPESRLQFESLSKANRNPEVYHVLEQRLRARLLLRKMLLSDVPPSTERHVYDLFKDDLTQYEVFEIQVDTTEDARQVEASLREGKSFGELAATSSVDAETRQEGGRLGFLTRGEIEATLGSDVADEVGGLAAGGHVPETPLWTPSGLLFIKIGKIRSSFDDLKPSIQDLIVGARRGAFLYRLTHDAKIRYPGGAGTTAEGEATPADATASPSPSEGPLGVFGTPPSASSKPGEKPPEIPPHP